MTMGGMRQFILLSSLVLTAACSESTVTPDAKAREFGETAAMAEQRMVTFGRVPRVYMKDLIIAWYRACDLQRAENGEYFGNIIAAFSEGYVQGMKNYPETAAQKPIQRMAKDQYWGGSTGCEDILQRTPGWMLEE